MKFLLIDDHALIREALQNVLKELACDAAILEASNFRQAQILIEQNADLEVILLDLNLPDGDGFNLLAQVREHSPQVSIVVVSANTDRDDVLRALDLGAVGFHSEIRSACRHARRSPTGAVRWRLHSTRNSRAGAILTSAICTKAPRHRSVALIAHRFWNNGTTD
jgi:DNA-binding NarL/FixJ family response regulator